jgi:hypothetical protein
LAAVLDDQAAPDDAAGGSVPALAA